MTDFLDTILLKPKSVLNIYAIIWLLFKPERCRYTMPSVIWTILPGRVKIIINTAVFLSTAIHK